MPTYFDHNATTPLHPDVLAAMQPHLTKPFGNPASVHRFGRAAHAAVQRARDEVAQLIGCRSSEVVFTSGGTESDNLAVKGVAAALDQASVPVLMATLGKALGTGGAFVAGSEDLVEALLQGARHYIYSTAPPPALAAATLTALDLLQRESWRREHLATLVQRFRSGAAQLGLPLGESQGPIQPLVTGDAARALALSAALRERGFLVSAIRPPTVPAGTARLRVTLSAAHSPEQVDALLQALADCGATR